MGSPKEIVVLKSQLYCLGGAEKYAWRLAQAFREKGNQVSILTTGPVPSSFQERGVKIISHRFSSKLSFRRIEEYDQFCKQNLEMIKPDIVFGLDRNRFQTHLRASSGVHAAYLQHRASQEGFWKKLFFKANPLHHSLLKIERASFEHPDLRMLFTNSNMVREEVLKHYDADPKKIQVVHNGVEWSEMQEDFDRWPERKKQLAEKLGLDTSQFHFLFIGHNYRRKGLEKLLEGLSHISHRDFHLSVIGKEKEGSHFIERAKKLGISNQVTFLGARTDIRSFYQLADALVIPSFYDPFANVTVEALAMGVFVVSSKTNGGHEILTPENGAVIEDLTESEAVASALQVALESPKTLARAQMIRDSAQHLDFAHQMRLLTTLS